MRNPEQSSTSQDAKRFARLDALYDAYCRQGGSDEPVTEDCSEDMIELACRYEPTVRRRFAKRAPQSH